MHTTRWNKRNELTFLFSLKRKHVSLLFWTPTWGSNRFPVSLQPQRWLMCHPSLVVQARFLLHVKHKVRQHGQHARYSSDVLNVSVIEVAQIQCFSQALAPMWAFLLAKAAFLHEGIWRFTWNVSGTVRDEEGRGMQRKEGFKGSMWSTCDMWCAQRSIQILAAASALHSSGI